MSPEQIHKIADKMNVSWDGDTDFMSWTFNKVGKKHLDDMTDSELISIYNAIKNGEYTKKLSEKWSVKYKKSINCKRPKGFSQRAHCAGRKKRRGESMYKEIEDSKYIMDMMREDVFGHRVTSYSPKDTKTLKNKLTQPSTDAEKEEYVDTVEPLMNKKSIIPKKKDKFLDAFLDLDTRVSQNDFEQTIDLDDYKKKRKPTILKKKETSDNQEEK